LRLQQRPEEHTVINLGAGSAYIAVVALVAYPLSLEDLGLALTAALASHDVESYSLPP
jgi:hypothetical protein